MTQSNRSLLAGGAFALTFCLILGGASEVATAEQSRATQQVSVEAGDLLIDGKPTRLYGIHFPIKPGLCSESLTGCRDLGLEAMVHWLDDAGPVDCEILSVTSSGTQIARCRQDQIDLGAWLVGYGYALADRRGGRGYIRDEQAARGENAGLWGNDGLLAHY